MVLTTGALIALGVLLSAAAAGTGTAAYLNTTGSWDSYNSTKAVEDYIRENFPELTDDEVDRLVKEFGDYDGYSIFDSSTWKDKSDLQAAITTAEDLQKLYDELGYYPEDLTIEQMEDIKNKAKSEIDENDAKIYELYDQVFKDSESLLQQELDENRQAYIDYRNQILTSNAMNQQMLAGSTRFELERQQRNAIVRGASAAQRLVANINTQLGMQAKSAQLSLDTSNALAQQLLMHREAQSKVRGDYLTLKNNDAANRANLMSTSITRRNDNASRALSEALDQRRIAQDAWNNRVSNYFAGNSTGETIYRRRYGSNKNSTQTNKDDDEQY